MNTDELVEKVALVLWETDGYSGPLPEDAEHFRNYINDAKPILDALGLLDGTNMLIPNWRDISEAPKDGTLLLLAKFGWASADPFNVWQSIGDQQHTIWWCTKGFWSQEWGNWNDGIEPSGLAGPTHFIPLSSIPTPEDGE